MDVQTGVSAHFVPGSFSPHAATGFPLLSAGLWWAELQGEGWVLTIRALSNTHLLCSDDAPSSYVDGSDFIIDFFDTGSLVSTLAVAGSKYAALKHNYEVLVCLQHNIIKILEGIKILLTLSSVFTIHQALSQALLSYFDWETYNTSWSGWSRYPPEGYL